MSIDKILVIPVNTPKNSTQKKNKIVILVQYLTHLDKSVTSSSKRKKIVQPTGELVASCLKIINKNKTAIKKTKKANKTDI